MATTMIATSYAGSVTFVGGNAGLTTSVAITTTGTFTQSPYSTTAFQGTGATTAETGSGVLCAGATPGTCTATTGLPSGEPNNEFAAANGVTFALLNQTVSGTAEGVWAATTSGTNSITIPIGIFGVTDVYTMLNDEYGVSGQSPTTVQFNFGNSTSESFTLVNGTVIRDDFDCTGGTGLAACQALNYATTLNIANGYSTNGTSLGAIGGIGAGTAYVDAFNVWSGTYGQGTGAYANTTGTLALDAQDFSLGNLAAGQTLTSITITDTAGAATKVSRDFLSAVTVASSGSAPATPEPSTVLLLVGGLGSVVLVRRRRKQ
jgi:hypothetical protein